jgi:hypothetical protein
MYLEKDSRQNKENFGEFNLDNTVQIVTPFEGCNAFLINCEDGVGNTAGVSPVI